MRDKSVRKESKTRDIVHLYTPFEIDAETEHDPSDELWLAIKRTLAPRRQINCRLAEPICIHICKKA